MGSLNSSFVRKRIYRKKYSGFDVFRNIKLGIADICKKCKIILVFLLSCSTSMIVSYGRIFLCEKLFIKTIKLYLTI